MKKKFVSIREIELPLIELNFFNKNKEIYKYTIIFFLFNDSFLYICKILLRGLIWFCIWLLGESLFNSKVVCNP